MKLWKKNLEADLAVERFTVGQDAVLDLQLAPFDVLGNLAQAAMLTRIGLLTAEELMALRQELIRLYPSTLDGSFIIESGVEDVHSQVELLLTRALGDTGKKIHTGRSRNDQVLLDLRLYTRSRIRQVAEKAAEVFALWSELSERHKDVLLPGYTHFQVAMPSSFGLWLGAYSESLVDDLIQLEAAYRIVNKNPLGSAAGYGSSFPLDRDYVTELLGFDDTVVNSVYAQMGRGKTERIVAQALAGMAATLGRIAMDGTLYLCQNYGFISFPPELTTGSSIMPHKKNPDVFEIMRARCNRLAALPNEIVLNHTNLPHGYHRDLQLVKEHFFPAFDDLLACLDMALLMFGNMTVHTGILDDERYKYAFSVEAVNELVQQGIPFRDAYREVGMAIEEGRFEVPQRLHHTHLGSMGNLGTERIRAAFAQVYDSFGFERVQQAEAAILGAR